MSDPNAPIVSMQRRDDRHVFDQALAALQGDVAMAAGFITNDAAVRQQYRRMIAQMAQEWMSKARSGLISWEQAAREAHAMRNLTLDVLRQRSSPVGRAVAEALKAQGRSLTELIAYYTSKTHGTQANFTALSQAQQAEIYGSIVGAAGRSNPSVNALVSKLSHTGRALIVVSLAISAYKVATSPTPGKEFVKEATITGAGIGGGIAGGALAGLACGPGAPVCVTVGAFVGGALAAFGVSFAW